MGDKILEREFEERRLHKTISLAKEQLQQAKDMAEKKKSEIVEAKKDLYENTEHSITNLWDSDSFEALAELCQYANPVTDKIADYEEEEHKILLLERLIKSPYFARVDFRFEDDDEFENIYIGRTSLKKDGHQERYVYDWRSPIASIFYRFMTGRAYYDAPCGRVSGEISLKRQYEIKEGELEYFFDADVQIVDEFLRQLLSQNTSSKMKAIVETIQKEQDLVIRDMENDLLMVQGVAGSGKTSIALHRAAYLMYQGLQSKLSANNIMIISPNTVFEQYIADVLPELGEENVVSFVFDDLMRAVLRSEQIQSKNAFLEKLIANSEDKAVIKHSIEFKTSKRFLHLLDKFLYDIPRRWIDFEDVFYEEECVISKEEMLEKVLGRIETPLGVKLEQLQDCILELIFETGKGRGHKEEKNLVKQEIQKFINLDVIELYKKLFGDKEYFYSLLSEDSPSQHNSLEDSSIEDNSSEDSSIEDNSSEDSSIEDNSSEHSSMEKIEEVWNYTQENLESGDLRYDDAIAVTYLYLKIFGTNEYRNMKQVVIDEAQDYYPLQYEIFNILFPNAKFTILGDMHQTLAKREDLSLYEQIREIIKKRRSSLITLDKSFRCTTEILNFSLHFILHNPEINSFNRSGDTPGIIVSDSEQTYMDQIMEEVRLCQEKGFQSIGLICKTEETSIRLFEKLKDQIDVQIIKNGEEADLKGTFVMPVYMSKGLEFDAVIICDVDDRNYVDEDDKNLLYVGCTRALHRLNLFCKGKISPLLYHIQ